MPLTINVEQSYKKWRRLLDLLDLSGDYSDRLHIGDFIDYDAGTWTASEIASIQVGDNENLVSASGSTSLPSSDFQFGGFATGTSRNTGATPYNSGTYMYAKMYEEGDSTNQVALSGWRIFDIDETTGEITLISAANPEDYYHPYLANSEYGYISQYILSGTIHSSWSKKETAEEAYTIRDWDMYINEDQGATSAKALTKTDLDNWYTKYITDGTSANTYTSATFQKIYSSPYLKYQNLIENHAYYWLSAAYSSALVYGVAPYYRYVLRSTNSSLAFGVRVLVTLSSNVYVGNEPTEKRVVTEDGMAFSGGEYGSETTNTYNVWSIK